MNLKRQLLLVGLLTLVLPWAGYRFVRDTELALRDGQLQTLAASTRLLAESLAQYPEEFPNNDDPAYEFGNRLYGHRLETRPRIDGYFDDWPLDRASLRTMRGVDGPIRYVLGVHEQAVYLYVEVTDRNVVFAAPGAGDDRTARADGVALVSISPPYREDELVFTAEAPGRIPVTLRDGDRPVPRPTIEAYWQDVPGGYRLEARIPTTELGTHLGLRVDNTASPDALPVQSASYSTRAPGAFVRESPELNAIAASRVPSGIRLYVTDSEGWRIAEVGRLGGGRSTAAGGLARLAYDALVGADEQAALAEPDPGGREHQEYVLRALEGRAGTSRFRSADNGRAVVAAAQPVTVGGEVVGAVILQQGSEAILSLTNRSLSRLVGITLGATLLVVSALLGYATWLSRRIRRLSTAAEKALENRGQDVRLPSGGDRDEIGDLSRRFSHVLRQLGDYNAYLRSLASKLSHEQRTPLAIVTSSLENLEHESLDDAARAYAGRARDGAERLRGILTAMSEASRVEELMEHAEPESFDLGKVLGAAVEAYRDVYPSRRFDFRGGERPAVVRGSPELLIQMLDKLVDNAAGFSADGDTVTVALEPDDERWRLVVANPGPPLPERMRSQLFDSMVSVRDGGDGRHLGLGLYVARLIAEGHGGTIVADNTANGVAVIVRLQGEQHGQ